MSRRIYEQIVAMAGQPDRQEQTLQYLTQHLGSFLQHGERVLICFREHTAENLSHLMEQAVLRCNAIPVVWREDHRWKTLLWLAFTNRASVIIGEPLLVLGLTKLRKKLATPLYIRRVITAGYPCPRWMIDGIAEGFDCVVGGCFSLGITGAVAGFACGQSWGVHIREDVYGVDIVDAQGQTTDQVGQMILYPKAAPALRLPTGEYARKESALCKCGCQAPRLLDFVSEAVRTPDMMALGRELQSWTSILDCRLQRGPYGLEIDLLVFQGEKLPKLPSAARLNIQVFNPEKDQPFLYDPSLRNPALRRD